MSRRDLEEKLLEDLLARYQSLGVVVWGQIEGAPGTYAKILVKSDGTVKVEGVLTLGSVDVTDRWSRELGQVDIARVLGYTIGVGNPIPTEIIYGSAVIDPRAIRYLSGTFDFVSAYVYGSQSMLLQQRGSTYDLLVQLRSGGTEIDPRQIRTLTASDVVSALAYGSQTQLLQQEATTKYLQTIPYGGGAQPLQQRAVTYDLLVQLRSAGSEIDPRDVLDRATRILGVITDISKVSGSHYLAPTVLGAGGTATIWTPASGKKIRLKRCQISVNAATRIDLRWTTIGVDTPFESYYLPANGSVVFNAVGVNEEGSVNYSLTLLSSAAATVTASAKGDEI